MITPFYNATFQIFPDFFTSFIEKERSYDVKQGFRFFQQV